MGDILINLCIFGIGLFFLIWASDWLIQGCVKLSFLFKLTPFFIGIIFVAFGTSTPELAVGISAALRNQKAIALGNVVGSNIANIGLVLGICCLLKPLKVSERVFKREVPLMLLSAVALYVLSLDQVLSRIDALVFLALFAVFCITSFKGAKNINESVEGLDDFKYKPLLLRTHSKRVASIISFAALVVLMLAAHTMVFSGVRLARIFGISPWIIGVTIFAVGTSLPELAASLSAAFKKVPSISVGNVVGSNIFNILLVLGVVTLIKPIPVALSVLAFELPLCVVFTFLFYLFMRTKYIITRKEGLVLLLGYIGFIVFLIGIQ